MTVGAVIFAQNNNSVDYVKMAAYSAQRVKQYLNIPVSIVTNSRGWLNKLELAPVFDKIIDIADNNELLSLYNKKCLVVIRNQQNPKKGILVFQSILKI